MKANLIAKLSSLILGLAIEGSFLVFADPGGPGSDCGETFMSALWQLTHLPFTALLPMEHDSDFLIAAAPYVLLWAALIYGLIFQPIRRS